MNNNYAVFAIVVGLEGGIPLVIEKTDFWGKKWKLPGGKARGNEPIEETLMRGVFEEINIVVLEPSEEIFQKHIKKDSDSYGFIVMKARYYNGKITAKNEIGRVELFSKLDIRKMINKGNILPNHAEALEKYFIL